MAKTAPTTAAPKTAKTTPSAEATAPAGPPPVRIFYAAGPGDVIGTYSHWKAGRDDPSQVSVTYSGQFYSVCKKLGAHGYVWSYNRAKEVVRDGNLTLIHRPVPFMRGPGPLFHLGQIWSGLRITWAAKKWKADVAVVSGGAHWFALYFMKTFGIKVVPTLHCVLWPKHRKLSRMRRIVRWFDGSFFKRRTVAAMSLSEDCTEQLRECAGKKRYPQPVLPFLPSYRRASFADIAPPDPKARPFRVMYAGRIEVNKGVYDLVTIAQRFKAEGRTDIAFDICGEGSHLEKLKKLAKESGLGDRFLFHGHVRRDAMRAMFARSHVLIAPTTGDFVEGFNKSVAEGVLAGRPVITSDVCPALQYVRDAVVEVPVDNVPAYGDAILRLADDRGLYASKVAGAKQSAEAFYDLDRSWAAALCFALDVAVPPPILQANAVKA